MMRRNICIVQVLEQPGSSSPILVSKLLKELLQLDNEVKIDRSHCSVVPKNIGSKLHYDCDGAEVLRKAGDWAPLSYNGNHFTIFPDYTTNVAKVRAAFTDVRKALQGWQEVPPWADLPS